MSVPMAKLFVNLIRYFVIS